MTLVEIKYYIFKAGADDNEVHKEVIDTIKEGNTNKWGWKV